MFKRFIAYYKPHKTLFMMDMLASFAVSVIAIIYPVITRQMLNNYIPNQNLQMIVYASLGLLVLYFIRMLLNYFIQFKGHMMGVAIQAEMRSNLFNHLEQLPFTFYDNNETGAIMTRMTNDLFEIAELAHHGPENIIISTITLILSFGYLCSIDIPLSLIIFAIVPILVFVASKLRKEFLEARRMTRKATSKINAQLQTSIAGIRVTKAFTNAKKESEKFEVNNEYFKQASKRDYRAMGRYGSSTSFITDIFNVVILLAGGMFLANGRIDFADYSAFIVSVNLFISPVRQLMGFMEQFQSGVSGFERYCEIMDTEVEKDSDDATDMGKVEGNIEIKNVSYGYDEDTDVLKNVSLNIAKGKKFALVGPSGGGKTTICHLIPRFYEIVNGAILIDGKDIREVTRDSLRKNIGIVQQDVYLFNDTIKNNILYGKLNATDEEVYEAARRANIHDYILTLPDGYETVVGERGVRLSGGQKQRLCIARVFLKDPAILILDEATSALDNTTEILIQQALDELCKGRTTFVVAHRLSTIKNADEIAVISNGEIIEQGTHEELFAQNGVYATLYAQQFREEK